MGRDHQQFHPLLRGGRRRRRGGGGGKCMHAFSAAQMESLASVCEAVLPPLQLQCLNKIRGNNNNNNNINVELEEPSPTKAEQFFWKASASQFSIPDQVSLSISIYCLSSQHKLSIVFFVFVCDIPKITQKINSPDQGDNEGLINFLQRDDWDL